MSFVLPQSSKGKKKKIRFWFLRLRVANGIHQKRRTILMLMRIKHLSGVIERGEMLFFLNT